MTARSPQPPAAAGSANEAPSPSAGDRRAALWLGALALVSAAMVLSTAYTYGNAAEFARERLEREGRRRARAVEKSLRRSARWTADKDQPSEAHTLLQAVMDDAVDEESVGFAFVTGGGQVKISAGAALPAAAPTADWARRARHEREVVLSPDTDGLVYAAVPTNIGCHDPRKPWRPKKHRGLRFGKRRPRPPGPCKDPNALLMVALDPSEARRPLNQARIQAVVVAAVLVLAWVLAWRWRRQTRRASHLETVARQREKMAALGEMAAVMAHEIRNPLGAIRGHAQLARGKLDGLGAEIAGAERAQRSLDTVVDETARLAGLVESLLSYARPRDPQLAPVLLRDVLSRVAALESAAAERAGVELELVPDGEGRSVRCDGDQIEQVLLNLVRNAVQAQPDGGRVVVSARGSELRVDDAGPGVPLDRRDEVFRPFVTSKSTGTGLGLAIARQIAESHGGTLFVEDSPLGGASFVLRLPEASEMVSKT